MRSSIDPATGGDIISLHVNSSLFGPGGIAGTLQPPPDDSIWLVDPFRGSPPPDDNVPALRFRLDSGGAILGPDPVPFRIFLGSPPPDDTRPGAGPSLLGLLDFSAVTGFLGSLNLSGVILRDINPSTGVLTGTTHSVAPFKIQSIPEPAAMLLMLTGLLGLFFMRTGYRRIEHQSRKPRVGAAQ